MIKTLFTKTEKSSIGDLQVSILQLEQDYKNLDSERRQVSDDFEKRLFAIRDDINKKEKLRDAIMEDKKK